MRKHSAYLFICFGALYYGCDKDVAPFEDPLPNPASINLIQNPSFEIGGQPSLQGWYVNSPPAPWAIPDTAQGNPVFINDVPGGGGNWSVKLTSPGQTPCDYLTATVSGQSGTNIYHLTVWAKCIAPWANSNIALGTWVPQTAYWKTVSLDSSTTWKKYSLSDTITTQSADTIMVRLQSGCGGPAGGTYLFDEIMLEKSGI
jgi:hypothetical protein